MVGEKLPFSGSPAPIPGVIMLGNYDVFEGGIGQGITYSDNSIKNEGDYRTTEYVDASSDINEGKVVGWIGAAEWMNYTVQVNQPGLYQIQIRYACGGCWCY